MIYAICDTHTGSPGDATVYFSFWSRRELAVQELARLGERGLGIVEIELDKPDNAP